MYDIPTYQTKYQRKIRGSQVFNISNSSSIIANSSLVIDLNENFKPYDDVLFTNLSSSDIIIYFNGLSNSAILPKGDSLNPQIPINDFKIENIGTSTINANEIRCYYRNSGDLNLITNQIQKGLIIGSAIKFLIGK